MLKYTNPLEPCIDPGFGYENGDGYVRVLDKTRPLGGKLVMRHRWFWSTFVGEIPEGFEINHLCKNRRCCNVNHLELLEVSEHRSKDNAERYLERKREVLEFIRVNPGLSRREVAEVFGLSKTTVCRYVNGDNRSK